MIDTRGARPQSAASFRDRINEDLVQRGADKFAVNTYSYTLEWTAERALKHLGDMGFSAFELMMYPGFLWPSDMDAAGRHHFRRFLAGHRFRLVTLNMPNVDINITGASAEMRAYSLDLVESFVRLAGDLGAGGIVIGVGKANPLFPMPRTQLEGHFFRALDRLVACAAQAETRLLIENMPFAWEPGAHGLMDLLARYGDGRIGVVYDVANAWFVGEDLGAGLRAVAPRLELVHLSDTTREAYRHDRVGLGDVPFEFLPQLLADIGHTMPPMLEIIDADADGGIRRSVDALLERGFSNPPRPKVAQLGGARA